MNTRIDARPRNRWDVQAGVRGAHLGMRGELIGGYAPDGRGLGTKAGATRTFAPQRPAGDPVDAAPMAAAEAPASKVSRPNALGGGLARWEQLNPNAKAAFSAGSPANDDATNRALARKAAKPGPDAGKVNAIVDQAMPRPAAPMPPVPGKMPAAVKPKLRRWDDGPAMADR